MAGRRLACLLIAWCGFAQSPPQSGVLTDAMRDTASLVASTKRAPAQFLTRFESSQYLETGSYAEALDFARKLERASSAVRVLKIGVTPQGRDLIVIVVSKDGAFDSVAAHKTGKPVVFIQNGIHAGEIAGKDASLMLLRDVVVTKKFAGWLDHVILAVMPVFNVDGHERVSVYNRINQNGPKAMGFRATATRYNLNRDYIKADTPEMRAWLRFYTAWLPEFFIDNHVTDGADYQYDLTIDAPTRQEVWPTVGAWTQDVYLPLLKQAMAADGHVMAPYGEFADPADASKGLVADAFSPRYSHIYAAAQNRASLLVETHSLKPHRTQVWSHYDLMRHTIDAVAAHASALTNAEQAADAAVAKLAGQGTVFLAGETDMSAGEPFVFQGVSSVNSASAISGGSYAVYGNTPLEINTQFFAKVKPTVMPRVPVAYAIPRQWTQVIELLRLHGVAMHPLAGRKTVEVEVYRFSAPTWAERPFEGHHLLAVKTAVVRERQEIPAGSMMVPMNQRAARVAMQILEPDAPDSAVRWNFFDTIFEQKEYFSPYVMEKIAKKMLDGDAKLRQEFENQVRSDSKFAANPRARLAWLYQHSKYYESDKDVYPVLRVMSLN